MTKAGGEESPLPCTTHHKKRTLGWKAVIIGGSGACPVTRAEAGGDELAEALEGLQRGQAQRNLKEVRAPRAQILHVRARLRTTPQSGRCLF